MGPRACAPAHTRQGAVEEAPAFSLLRPHGTVSHCNSWSEAGRPDLPGPAWTLLSSFFLLLLGAHKPSHDREGANNLLPRCGEAGTGRLGVPAMAARPGPARRGADPRRGKDGRAALINSFHPQPR